MKPPEVTLAEREAAVRAELRPGGRPVLAYFVQGFDRAGTLLEQQASVRLTNAILEHMEERFLALEAKR